MRLRRDDLYALTGAVVAGVCAYITWIVNKAQRR